MTDFERQESGCPMRLCSSDCDRCAISDGCKDVTGFAMCAVDWESCADYIKATQGKKRG